MAGGVDDCAQSKRELEQIRKIKERQKRMNELDQEAYKAEQLINTGKWIKKQSKTLITLGENYYYQY